MTEFAAGVTRVFDQPNPYDAGNLILRFGWRVAHACRRALPGALGGTAVLSRSGFRRRRFGVAA